MAERLSEKIIETNEINLGNTKDPVTAYLQQLENSLTKLQKPLSWNMSHNRRRSVRGMALAREQRLHQLRATQDAIETIKGKNYDEIKLFVDRNNKVMGFSVKS